MKTKLLAAVALGALWSVSAQAENTGCGLGSMAWEGQSGIAPQVLAVTTNGTSGNQTFGITSGTLGCTRDGVVRSTAALGMYTGSNMDLIARDMSVGEGESLDVLAELMGIEAEDRQAFKTTLQQNYGSIFSSSEVTADDVISAIDDALREDAELSRYAV
ncbi:DUF3015 domain-containing protein [Methylonatrum kenyense]|uniref:DUF3015 domain-containing protein n=1 Tax=Methylonatrum kenyense TaxID=455253 RepID=UPI0020BFADCC|nr:DUF3015 domain-containing protein [Methylonatrum kenyense]MCK8515443.1 DUF3015 domain-containing protein [Methylonatrum kenyense]